MIGVQVRTRRVDAQVEARATRGLLGRARSRGLGFAVIAAACSGGTPSPAAHEPAGPAAAVAPHPSASAAPRPAAIARPELDPIRIPLPPSQDGAPPRIVAIGDVHGDLAATRRALKLAGAIDDADRWIGGSLVVVQTGDQLDRGDDEQAILDLLDGLVAQAKAAGGALVVLNGNHEVMNALGDFRYVTPAGMRDFDGVQGANLDDPRLASLPAELRARAAAFIPGGPYAKRLAERHVAVIVGDTAFVHGGIAPEHVPMLPKLDAGVRDLLAGREVSSEIVQAAMDPEGPLWTREFAWTDEPAACQRLGQSLAALGVSRMVVGHTVQEEGVTSACEGRVWRIDVGMAAHYGGPTQVIEIRGAEVKVLGDR
jgi:hypothetical protein